MAGLRRSVSVLVLLVASGFAQARADELRGVALVIGEADYESLTDLDNTLNDARAMDDMLSELGFDVTRVLDRGGDRLRGAIEDFVADAKGADVALVYYAGHAVEAAGQNYIVPIDADLSTPRAAGGSVVPVTQLLDDLSRIVPVTIMLLDACRTEAFPSGAALLLPGESEPVPIDGTGLGEMRGPTPVLANVAPESLGMVIGFAASPGQAALDGVAGGNSPYAAALLKHLSAGGFSFGDVMTMVTEEVYLKTGARQIPWTNSSLRRVLSFEAIEDDGGDEALIRDGRRNLLLSIAQMPGDVRLQVEAAANEAAVPMDTLYGLLDALGQETPADPGALNELLKAQTETIRQVMAERETLSSTDPEIVRLSELAQRALDEGALEVSVAFWEQAKARYGEISVSLDETEAMLSARRLEGGALLARTAAAYRLTGDYVSSAENYQLAFAEVERWDAARAIEYKRGEAQALYDQGVQKGDNAALTNSIAAFEAAIGMMAEDDPQWGPVHYDLGGALGQMATRNADNAIEARAVAAFGLALDAEDRDVDPVTWAKAQTGLGTILSMVGERETANDKLLASIDAFHLALEELSPDATPIEWGVAQNNLANTLRMLGERQAGLEGLQAAADAFRAALSVASRERQPYDWAIAQSNLGAALLAIGARQDESDNLAAAIDAFRLTLEVATRERMPLQWAMTQSNLGTALRLMGEREDGTKWFEESLVAYRLALAEVGPERSLLDWSIAQTNMATALMRLGQRGAGRSYLNDAVEAFRLVTTTLERRQAPQQWALAQNNLGAALNMLAEEEEGAALYVEALTALQAALSERPRDSMPVDWSMTQGNIGTALRGIGMAEQGTQSLTGSAEAYRLALEETDRAETPQRWAELQHKRADVLLEIGLREGQGIESFRAAVDAYNAALEIYTYEADPLMWATVVNSVGWTIGNAGYRMGDIATMQQGRDAIQAAWDTVRAHGQSEHDEYFAARLADIDAAIAAAETAQRPEATAPSH